MNRMTPEEANQLCEGIDYNDGLGEASPVTPAVAVSPDRQRPARRSGTASRISAPVPVNRGGLKKDPSLWTFTTHGLGPISTNFFAKKYAETIGNPQMWSQNCTALRVTKKKVQDELAEFEQITAGHDVTSLPGLDGVGVDICTNMDPVMSNVFGDSLKYMGIKDLFSGVDIYDGGNRETKVVDLVGVMLPLVGNKPTFVNRLGQRMGHGNFWDGHMEWRNEKRTRDTGVVKKFGFIELAFKVPQVFLESQIRREHIEVLKRLHDCNDSLMALEGGAQFMKLTLYRDAAYAFKGLVNNVVCKTAMMHGWVPILAVKNALIQTVGGKEYRLASCNLHQKSFISLIGFWKQNSSDNANSYSLIGFRYESVPLTTYECKFGEIEEEG